MPKKKTAESEAEQSERFRRDAQALIDAGELNPTDAEAGMDGLVKRMGRKDQAITGTPPK